MLKLIITLAVWSSVTMTSLAEPSVAFDTLTMDDQIKYITLIRPDPPPPIHTVRYTPQTDFSGGIEQWRDLVSEYFPADWVNWALAIVRCESTGDPTATHRTSGAAGLFQHLPKFWADRSTRAGWAGADIYDPRANVAVAAWLLKTGGTSHWVCKASR